MPTVNCIHIDAKNKTINPISLDIPFDDNGPRSYPLGYKDGYVVFYDGIKRNEHTTIYYNDSNIKDPKHVLNYGFLYWSDALTGSNKKCTFSERVGQYRAINGDALIVSYKKKAEKNKTLYTPVDVAITPNDAARLIGEFTDGIQRRLPDFTCMVNEKFSKTGYEILLRIENEEEMYSQYDDELTQPIRNLTPQIITFGLNHNEITIMTGRIDNLDQIVQVSIFESDRADLRCIASCKLAANKIPSWVRGRLRDFFLEHVSVFPFHM